VTAALEASPGTAVLADDALLAEWDDLADRVGANPFQRPGWYRAWWSAFGTSPVRLVQVRRDGRLAGVLPVTRRWGRVTTLDNWHSFLCGPLAEDTATRASLVDRAISAAGLSADLGHLGTDDAEHVAALALDRGCRVRRSIIQRSPFVALDGTFETYRGGLSSKFVGRIRSRRRKLEQTGELRLQVHTAPQHVEGALRELLRIENLGWKAAQGSSIVAQEPTHRFYRSVAGWAASTGLLELSLLTLGGRTIAGELALVDGQSHYGLKMGIDPEFRSAGPGFILAHDLIERSFSQGLATFEFMGSASEEKLRWTAATRCIEQVRLYPPTVGGRAARLAGAGVAVGRRAGSVAGRLADRPVRAIGGAVGRGTRSGGAAAATGAAGAGPAPS
jgi:CelD/BcsL family acetyltransferase involved in cellulose biosynthesis